MHLVSGHNQPKDDVMDDLSNGEDYEKLKFYSVIRHGWRDLLPH
jgi:hypothetical protein